MAQRDTDRKEPSKHGPEAERLKIDDDPEEALQRLFHAGMKPISIDYKGRRLWSKAVEVPDGYKPCYRVGDSTDAVQLVDLWVESEEVLDSAEAARVRGLDIAREEVDRG